MTERLPTVAGDSNAWGTILNGYLGVAHNSDGTQKDATVSETSLTLTDITTSNASTSKHGLLPKLDNNTAHFLNGQGGWTAPAGSGGGLPDGWVNVADYGLLDDSGLGAPGTNNTSALQSLIDSIPITTAGIATVFVWPKTSGKSYGFTSQVNWGNHSIRNIGLGSAAWNDQRGVTSVMSLADSITIFSCVSADTSSNFHGPAFEEFSFTSGDDSYTAVKGIEFKDITRCSLRRCTFYNLHVGIETNENVSDCAWHKFYDCIFYACDTGWHSTSCNSIDVFSPDIQNCGVGFDLDLTNQVNIYGGKINSPVVNTGVNTGNPAIGIRIGSGSSAIMIDGTQVELQVGSSARTAFYISGDQNDIRSVGLHAGDSANTNLGIVLASGADSNSVAWRYASSFTDNTYLIQDSGIRNRIQYGAYVSTTGNLPTSADISRRGTLRHNLDTGVTQIANGTSWVSLGGPTSIVAKTADQNVNNSVTLVDDTHLKLVLTGDSTSKYFLECFLLIDAVDAACDIKLAFTSGLATVRWAGLDSGTVTPSWGGVAVGTTGVVSNTAATTSSYGSVTAAATEMPLSLAAYVADGGSSGNLFLRWAQNTATSGNLTLKAGSFMRITKIA